MSTEGRKPPNEPGPDHSVDPDAPPTEAELAAAAELARALERGPAGAPGDADWQLVEAIRAAASPSPISEDRQRELLRSAMSRRPGSRVIYLAFGGVASLAAMAAAFALVAGGPAREKLAATSPEAPMAVSRSTSDLFPDGIPARGGTSDRVGRIAYARARDLRENRFASWGVR